MNFKSAAAVIATSYFASSVFAFDGGIPSGARPSPQPYQAKTQAELTEERAVYKALIGDNISKYTLAISMFQDLLSLMQAHESLSPSPMLANALTEEQMYERIRQVIASVPADPNDEQVCRDYEIESPIFSLIELYPSMFTDEVMKALTPKFRKLMKIVQNDD